MNHLMPDQKSFVLFVLGHSFMAERISSGTAASGLKQQYRRADWLGAWKLLTAQLIW